MKLLGKRKTKERKGELTERNEMPIKLKIKTFVKMILRLKKRLDLLRNRNK